LATKHSPHHPYTSSLTGQSAANFCNAYTKATGKQRPQPIGFQHAVCEIWAETLQWAKILKESQVINRLPIPSWTRLSDRSNSTIRVTAGPHWWAASGQAEKISLGTENRLQWAAPEHPLTGEMKPVN
jgi:branched-chain amino acid transport system substrate-binding protein